LKLVVDPVPEAIAAAQGSPEEEISMFSVRSSIDFVELNYNSTF
jgi:hypothetical protein